MPISRPLVPACHEERKRNAQVPQFRQKSLNEIKDKLLELGLSLGVQVDPPCLPVPCRGMKPRLGLEEESPVGLADLIAANIEDDDD